MALLYFNDFINEDMSKKELAGWIGIGIATSVLYDGIKRLISFMKKDDEKLKKLKEELKNTDKSETLKRTRLQTKINVIEEKILRQKQKLEQSKEKLEAAKEKEKEKMIKYYNDFLLDLPNTFLELFEQTSEYLNENLDYNNILNLDLFEKRDETTVQLALKKLKYLFNKRKRILVKKIQINKGTYKENIFKKHFKALKEWFIKMSKKLFNKNESLIYESYIESTNEDYIKQREKDFYYMLNKNNKFNLTIYMRCISYALLKIDTTLIKYENFIEWIYLFLLKDFMEILSDEFGVYNNIDLTTNIIMKKTINNMKETNVGFITIGNTNKKSKLEITVKLKNGYIDLNINSIGFFKNNKILIFNNSIDFTISDLYSYIKNNYYYKIKNDNIKYMLWSQAPDDDNTESYYNINGILSKDSYNKNKIIIDELNKLSFSSTDKGKIIYKNKIGDYIKIYKNVINIYVKNTDTNQDIKYIPGTQGSRFGFITTIILLPDNYNFENNFWLNEFVNLLDYINLNYKYSFKMNMNKIKEINNILYKYLNKMK